MVKQFFCRILAGLIVGLIRHQLPVQNDSALSQHKLGDIKMSKGLHGQQVPINYSY
jgi:hypothetical protein